MAGQRTIEGKVAIVTGAAGAIGRAEALALARAGASVLANDLRGADAVAQEIRRAGGQAASLDADVASAGASIVEAAIEAFGGLDILVNNAGIGRRSPIEAASDADWDEVVAVNLKGAFSTIKAAAPHLRAGGGGVIVNTSSDAGTGTWGFASYAATKEGLVGLTRAVAWELGRHGVVTFAIRPRAFDGARTPAGKLDSFKAFEARTGLPMVGAHSWLRAIFPEADEVGEMVAWLCAHAPAGLNGRVLQLGGGEIGLWAEPRVERAFVREEPWDAAALDAIGDQLFEGLTDVPAQLDDAAWRELTERTIRKEPVG